MSVHFLLNKHPPRVPPWLRHVIGAWRGRAGVSDEPGRAPRSHLRHINHPLTRERKHTTGDKDIIPVAGRLSHADPPREVCVCADGQPDSDLSNRRLEGRCLTAMPPPPPARPVGATARPRHPLVRLSSEYEWGKSSPLILVALSHTLY